MILSNPHSLLQRHVATSLPQLSQSQIALDAALEGFHHEATNPLTLLSMTTASLSFKLARLSFLQGAQATGLARLAPRWSINLSSFLFGLGVETTTFRFAQQSFTHIFAAPSSRVPLEHSSWNSTALDLFTLKTFGSIFQSQNIFLSHFIQANALVLAQDLSAQLGWIAHNKASYAQRLGEAAALNLSLSAGMGLVGVLGQGRIHSVEKRWEVQAQSLETSLQTRQAQRISPSPFVFASEATQSRESWRNLSERHFEERLLAEKLAPVLTRARDRISPRVRDLALAELQVISEYFIERGYAANPFEVQLAHLGALEWVQSTLKDHPSPSKNLKHLGERLSQRDRDFNQRHALAFLNMALHADTGAFLFLSMARQALAHSALTWPELIRLQGESISAYERFALDFLRRQEGRPLPLDRYFRFLMYDSPESVYCSKSPTPLIDADHGYFETVSEYRYFHHFFAYKALETWRELGKPASFSVVEMGAGTGQLARGLLSEIRQLSRQNAEFAELDQALSYHILEISPELAAVQARNLIEFIDKVEIHRGSALQTENDFFERQIETGMVISVELLDMFPPKGVRRQGSEISEMHFTVEDGRIRKSYEVLSDETRAYLSRHPLPESWAGNFDYPLHPSIEVWLQNIRKILRRGRVFSLDYGFSRSEMVMDPSPTFPRIRAFPRIPEKNFWMQLRDFFEGPFFLLYHHAFRSFTHSLSGLSLKADFTAEVDFTAVNEAAQNIAGFQIRPEPFQNLNTAMQRMAERESAYKSSPHYAMGQSSTFPRGLIFHEIEVKPD